MDLVPDDHFLLEFEYLFIFRLNVKFELQDSDYG